MAEIVGYASDGVLVKFDWYEVRKMKHSLDAHQPEEEANNG